MGDKRNGFSTVNFEEIKIPVPWGHISGKWWGSKTEQPILAIHGWQDNAGSFDNLAPLLVERGHPILCVDLPGHGLSSHFSDGHQYYLFWDGIHLLRRIVKHFNWENITIIGHSLGGGIAFLYAAVYPQEVAKYISIDIASPSVRSPQKILEQIGGAVDKFLRYETLQSHEVPCYPYEEMLDIMEDAHNGSITRQNCRIMLKRGMRPSPEKKDCYVFNRDPRLKVAGLGFFTQDQVLEFAARIKCQVLNIRGKQGYKFENPLIYDMVLDAIEKQAKKIERHLVEGTHHLHLNNPEDMIDIVDNFLRS